MTTKSGSESSLDLSGRAADMLGVGTQFVTLDVGGHIFKTTLPVLQRERDSVLAHIARGVQLDPHRGSLSHDGLSDDNASPPHLTVDGDGALFAHVLAWLRYESVPRELPPCDLNNLIAMARHMNLVKFADALSKTNKNMRVSQQQFLLVCFCFLFCPFSNKKKVACCCCLC